jgi:hypothetical protein
MQDPAFCKVNADPNLSCIATTFLPNPLIDRVGCRRAKPAAAPLFL